MPEDAKPNRVLIAVLAILIGWTGIHKFMLGDTKNGIIVLVSNIACCAGSIIGLVEGIIYLTKTDEQFYQMYVVEKKAWF